MYSTTLLLGPDLTADSSGWTHTLTPTEVAELDAALLSAETAGLEIIDLTAENFPLPALAPRLRALQLELVSGRGLALMRGLPVARYSPWQVCAAFYGLVGAYTRSLFSST